MHAESLMRWLVREAKDLQDTAALLAELGRRLNALEVPVKRLNCGAYVLHPMVRDINYLWERGQQRAAYREFSHGIEQNPSYTRSPIADLHQGLPMLRRRLDGDPAAFDYPILAELRAAGFSDYLGFSFHFSSGAVNACTFATDRDGGFEDAEIALLQRVVELLALVLEIRVQQRVAGVLLDTYLGADAGKRVLAGQIRRGDCETIHAVIWCSDLRGFTPLADRLPREQLVGLLNAFFERQVAPIQERGGEVLKFMGDGLLAIFRVDGQRDAEAACRDAYTAALDATRRLNEYNEDPNHPPMRIGLALHLGDVEFGNLGAPDRLDFTVIGEAVNLASRIEGLCKALGRPLLLSGAVAARVGDLAELEALGPQRVVGFDRPVQVFAPIRGR